jgi:hypothetical protein
MNVYAQGDVILVQVDDNIEIKPERVIVPSGHPVVLAEGEHTGHRHAFYDGAVLFRDQALASDVPPELYIGHVRISSGGSAARTWYGPRH